ncbi:MAG: hypothetical protein COW03_05815 [Cytophagales bacterium CG12_big_fil_rev_8_21_14_0_65_40_12]|nr:MAG: hypothetical protein COW03_05815 [Cytophagales bacterium CG12_big_fil_rev_8_21_14_0_65_40_12]PIW04417.1 MAG: hypothetical protein COW40_09890 [Cytophagales bacterium CG17_big_fil_post_rev_8_21_14_2_50_40_13]
MQNQMKNTKAKFIMVFILALIAIKAKAQQVPLFNQYYYSPSLAYSSGTVFEEDRYISLIFRDQFGGLIGSPKNFALAYNSAVHNKIAFSGNITTADIGFTSQVKLSGGLGYKLFRKGDQGLSIGTQFGLSFFSLNEDRVNPENSADNVLIDLLGQNGSSFSVDLSVSYRLGELGIDIAIPTVINESLSDDAYIRINDDNVPDFIGGARYEFSLNPDLSFTPYAGVRLRETIGAELDVMGELNFKDKFRATVGYRDNYGASAGLGAQIFPKVLFTYNYDFGQKDAPFLADGFSEFALHLKLNKVEDKIDACTQEGLEVVNKIVDQRIFDENLVNPEDKEKALCYLSSLEVGKRKEQYQKAEQAYQALFLKIKTEEIARQEATRLAALQAEKLKQEEAVTAERERLAEIERIELQKRKAMAEQKELELKKALSLVTESVSFNSGSSVLTKTSFESLNVLVALLNENPDISLSIAGYTDNSGKAEANLQLSKVRAQAVKDYLVDQGIAADRLAAAGYGIANPRADNATKEGRALNRRVEIKIMEE